MNEPTDDFLAEHVVVPPGSPPGSPPGIVTSLPPTPDTGDIWARLLRLYDQVAIRQPWPAQLRCGQSVRDSVATTWPKADPAPVWAPTHGLDALLAIPIVLDEELPPNAWKLVDADGNVLREGTG